MLHKQHTFYLQWNLRNKETTGPHKGVLISEVSLIRRLHYKYNRVHKNEEYRTAHYTNGDNRWERNVTNT